MLFRDPGEWEIRGIYLEGLDLLTIRFSFEEIKTVNYPGRPHIFGSVSTPLLKFIDKFELDHRIRFFQSA